MPAVNWDEIPDEPVRPGVRRRGFGTNDVMLNDCEPGMAVRPHTHAFIEPRAGRRHNRLICSTSGMGRVGIEPTTLGLRVRPNELPRTAGNGIYLQTRTSQRRANGDELQPTEPIPYAHSYARCAAHARHELAPAVPA
jgi:hypothetical protein